MTATEKVAIVFGHVVQALAFIVLVVGLLLTAVFFRDWFRVSRDWTDLLFGEKRGMGVLGGLTLLFTLSLSVALRSVARWVQRQAKK
ncbi:hypothetical protein [Mesorhizobium sp. IMUNJ 23232]|uniref:hypothetical protein n=1 Tax=Mesorhizobium sp. IMUNJ 23232 TaxID=3376064 RepID=UPI00378E3955